MKQLYIVTADTYTEDSYGTEIELLRVTDNMKEAEESAQYARTKNWYPHISTVTLNKPIRHYLGGLVE